MNDIINVLGLEDESVQPTLNYLTEDPYIKGTRLLCAYVSWANLFGHVQFTGSTPNYLSLTWGTVLQW